MTCVLGMCAGAAEDSADQADPDGGDTAALREVPRRTGHARAKPHPYTLLTTFSSCGKDVQIGGLG